MGAKMVLSTVLVWAVFGRPVDRWATDTDTLAVVLLVSF